MSPSRPGSGGPSRGRTKAEPNPASGRPREKAESTRPEPAHRINEPPTGPSATPLKGEPTGPGLPPFTGEPTGPRGSRSKEDSIMVQMSLPVATMAILATEADLWGVPRGDFLTMLLRRRFGELVFERPKHAPTYQFTREQFDKTDRYAWYVRKPDMP